MSAVETVTVGLADRAYEIRVGEGLVAGADDALADLIRDRHVVVVADPALAGAPAASLEAALRRAPVRRVDRLTTASGEAGKSFEHLQNLLERILALGIDRRTLLIAFGGGVVGDIVGFAAAILLRGLDFVQIPTTLLAQVDSSVGGKTGINAARGKNLVGAFHQPVRVLIDIALLDSLPRRELLAGYAEVVKYGAIGDAAFFEWLEANGAQLLAGDPALRRQAIMRSCTAKAEIVMQDEREAAGGRRALLNFGHTFAHALEAMAGYDGSLLHGEAVAIGMVLAARLSVRLESCSGQDAERLTAHLRSVGLPTGIAAADGAVSAREAETLLEHMTRDKKARDGRIVFITLERLGAARVRADVDPGLALDVLRRPRAA